MIAERVITVEYLVPSMSKDLLGKFPDSSAFGFNYAESGIWSPLLPRGRRSHDESKLVLSSESFKKMKERMLMKSTIKKKKKNAVNKKLDFSPKPTPKRGWDRLLKAAAKRFKPQRRSAIKTIIRTIRDVNCSC